MSKKQEETSFVDVQETLSNWETKIENNKQPLIIIASAIILIVVLYFSWTKLYIGPQEQKAQSEMFAAEKYFAKDSLDKAMFGDGKNSGFSDIIDSYGMTKAANLANYYMGICHLKKGEYTEAIAFLKDFKSDDMVLSSISIGATGDAYSELQNYNEAVAYYLKAANNNKNKFSSPIFLMKAGAVYEEMADYENAIKVYEKIKKEYAETNEGREIEKYIGRAKTLAGK